MKKTLFLALMLFIGATAFAQTQMATLNHNDSISLFYGANALLEAHNASVDGDVITLSSGNFYIGYLQGEMITKNITIRGAGCAFDSINGTNLTIISSPSTTTTITANDIDIEGITFNLTVTTRCNNIRAIKCYFTKLYISSPNNSNIDLVNCVLKSFYLNAKNADVSFVNSVIYRYECTTGQQSSFNMMNSLVFLDENIDNVLANNCIISRFRRHDSFQDYHLGTGSIANNCIFITIDDATNNGPIYNGIESLTNLFVKNLYDVFETYFDINNFSFDERYTLREEIATSFLGSDGTQVGIHGGIFPFNTRPSYMLVKKCNVANKSTIDGKLSVDIEVMVEE